MNKKPLILLMLSFSIFFMVPLPSKAEVVDKVLAVVNDELITQSELDRFLNPIYKQYEQMYKGEELLVKLDEARTAILNQLIIDKLVLYEARKREIKIDPKEVKERVEELKSKFPSEGVFEQTLIAEGTTLAELQKRFEEELLKGKFIDMEVKRNVVITPAEIRDYYNANKEKFRMPPQAKVLNILIKITEERSKEKTYTMAKEIQERLKKGEDFSELARAYSDGVYAEGGGNMGYVSQGKLKEEFDKVIFSLEIGEFSDIVESELGYHIFMVLDKKDEAIMELEELYDKIRNVLYKEKAQSIFEKLIVELRKNAYISIK